MQYALILPYIYNGNAVHIFSPSRLSKIKLLIVQSPHPQLFAVKGICVHQRFSL